MSLKIIHGNLFNASAEYAFAHCVSADFALGTGIARQFDRYFHVREKLIKDYPDAMNHWQSGMHGFCCKENSSNRTIFNLATKERYWQKPTYATLRNALADMKTQCRKNSIYRIAMPAIGCGLDRLSWTDVEKILNCTFNDNFDLLVYML